MVGVTTGPIQEIMLGVTTTKPIEVEVNPMQILPEIVKKAPNIQQNTMDNLVLHRFDVLEIIIF